MHWTEDCICSQSTIKAIEFFNINNSRVELRCRRCKGLMGWWDVPQNTRKIIPFKRECSEEERLAMR